MKCSDCGDAALWVFNDPGAASVLYCDRCLPLFLRRRAVEGSLGRVE